MENSWLPLAIVTSSLLPAVVIFFLKEEWHRTRSTLNMLGACVKISLVGLLLWDVFNGVEHEFRYSLLPEMDLVLHADAFSALFVTLSSFLWFLTTLYAIGYLEDMPHRSRFFGFFSLCVTSTMGIAMAGNMVTFLVFYEMLTLVTYPLIVHRGTPEALRAGRLYLKYTLTGGMVLLLGVVWLRSLVGPLDFTETGLLATHTAIPEGVLVAIFFLMIAGLGVKSAFIPFHGWLPGAMVAVAPVSALLHAVAVVKAGSFGIIRVLYDVYGIQFAAQLGVTAPLAILAAATIIYGSIRACFQTEIKKRLAYSTVSQVSYIVLGAAIAGPFATIGGVVHLVHQGLMKITLFFCAGNLAKTLGVHSIEELDGAGKRMPITMAAFTLAALGMIGVPPMAGFVSKWYLGWGAVRMEQYWVLPVLLISSLLNAIYFLPLIYRAWFKPQNHSWHHESTERGIAGTETSSLLWLPPLITATLALLAGVFAGSDISPLAWVKLISEREFIQ